MWSTVVIAEQAVGRHVRHLLQFVEDIAIEHLDTVVLLNRST